MCSNDSRPQTLFFQALVNEMFGDGIISAIDFYATVDSVEGKAGERRVVRFLTLLCSLGRVKQSFGSAACSCDALCKDNLPVC